jgi:CheY-like chemotaxis protein
MSRVLMVDNALLFRMLDASFLRRTGWEVVRVPSSETIASRARDLGPDLVLLDTRDIDLDAEAVVTTLKREAAGAAVPVVVLTDAPTATRCVAAGAEAVLTHPVDAAALEAALAGLGRVVSRRGARRAVRMPARVTVPGAVHRARVKDLGR